ncbi:TPA: hypothetical protein DDW35_00760 [Candidatus Sumerlaeota bacterium]|nr:hypothetical protein [Candidatus Sumerlaeota bacterium]
MVLVHSHTLSNGARVLFRPTPDKQILSVAAAVPWGARNDAAEQAGRTSLMARLLTKGAGERSAFQIADALESIGGSIDSFCTPDALGMETHTVQVDWKLALEVLSDCLFRPTFDAEEFDKERALVQSEILRENDRKFSFTYKAFQKLYYRGHPYAVSSEGEIETVAKLERAMLPSLHASVMDPSQMLIVAVGNVPEEEFLSELESRWPQNAAAPAAIAKGVTIAAGAGRGERVEVSREFEQGFVIAGYPAPDAGAEDSAALRLACAILGEGMSARLFARLRDRDHLAYAVGASFSVRALASQMVAYIGTGADTVDQALEGIVRETQGLLSNAPTTEEIERARQYILGKYLIGRQTNAALTQSMLGCEMLGLGWEYGETFPERIQSVTAAQIQEAAEKYLTNPAIAVLRPSGKPGAEAIIDDEEDDEEEGDE